MLRTLTGRSIFMLIFKISVQNQAPHLRFDVDVQLEKLVLFLQEKEIPESHRP